MQRRPKSLLTSYGFRTIGSSSSIVDIDPDLIGLKLMFGDDVFVASVDLFFESPPDAGKEAVSPLPPWAVAPG